ncbi:MAG TPA: hypothetical protein VLW55_18975 [Burkholderiaceae bacterium]|nr:hypothetical protein [Burkholderiaceae bacterium]
MLNTPVTFPVQFRESKIDGGLVRVTLPEMHGFRAYATLSHTSARLFGPELGGLRFSAGCAPEARPDHDEPFQQTTHIEYRTSRLLGLWGGLTWRDDSGLVAVSVPTYADALQLTGDEQAAHADIDGTYSLPLIPSLRFERMVDRSEQTAGVASWMAVVDTAECDRRGTMMTSAGERRAAPVTGLRSVWCGAEGWTYHSAVGLAQRGR